MLMSVNLLLLMILIVMVLLLLSLAQQLLWLLLLQMGLRPLLWLGVTLHTQVGSPQPLASSDLQP